MVKFRYLTLLFCSFCFIMILIVSKPGISSSQQLSISHGDYLKAIGWEDNFIVMKNILKNRLMQQIDDKPEAYYEDNANFFSMVLLLSGVEPIDYYRLEENGVDVIHAITADVRPFDEQSLLSDVVILGDVVEIVDDSTIDDGFDRTVKVKVTDVLKGSVLVDTVQIRRRKPSNMLRNDIRPELNRSYLLLLSSGMYGYHTANHHFRQKKEVVVSPPQFGHEKVFVIYRIYPYINGALYYSPQNRTAAFNSLERVDRLLNRE